MIGYVTFQHGAANRSLTSVAFNSITVATDPIHNPRSDPDYYQGQWVIRVSDAGSGSYRLRRMPGCICMLVGHAVFTDIAIAVI